MRVGIVVLADRRWSDGAQRWRRAEEYGFDHAWTYDHIGWRDLVDGPWFDAVPTLTAAALSTSRIRLGTLVASPNFRHPVPFAREVTALDDISGGRILLGLGAGGTGYDATVLGRARAAGPGAGRPVRRVRRAARRDPGQRPGHLARPVLPAVDARSAPGCVQRPRVPFVVAANGPRSMAAGRRASVRAGSPPAPPATRDLEAWWRAVATLAARFTDALAAAGREPSSVDRYLSLDAAPVFSLSSAEYFADATARAAELGFTDVVTHWPRSEGWYAGDEAVLDTVAADILPRL